MSELFQGAEARLVLLVAALAALLVVGIYVVSRVRRQVTSRDPAGQELVSNFRELHSRGELSDEEYRNIKTTLASKAPRGLKGKGQEG